MKKFDRFIFTNLLVITIFVLFIFIFIFIMIDFSENSDDFTDRGATMAEIWGDYYLNYIPEMIRLVSPVSIFSACLFLTGRLSERLEITALKAAGVSLYRILVPYFVFALCTAGTISLLDAYVIPTSNKQRIEFEDTYLKQRNESIDRSQIYRELNKNSILSVNYFDDDSETAFQVRFIEYDSLTLRKTTNATSMSWQEDINKWRLSSVFERVYTDTSMTVTRYPGKDTTLTILPQDLARSTSDVYQLTYGEAQDYILAIERSGAGGIEIPKVHFYGRLAYPISILVVILIGFSIASERRRGGKGVYIATGLIISFLYLSFMKIAEPFGYYGTLTPAMAATLPHITFFILGSILLLRAKK